MQATVSAEIPVSSTFPPFVTGLNTGPSLICETSIHCSSAATGHNTACAEEWKPRGHDLIGLSCCGECR